MRIRLTNTITNDAKIPQGRQYSRDVARIEPQIAKHDRAQAEKEETDIKCVVLDANECVSQFLALAKKANILVIIVSNQKTSAALAENRGDISAILWAVKPVLIDLSDLRRSGTGD
jgi:predicted HAD superfamily phosphohydrolase YqeG